jgi:hypothetical protein
MAPTWRRTQQEMYRRRVALVATTPSGEIVQDSSPLPPKWRQRYCLST